MNKSEELDNLKNIASKCTRCDLSKSRTQVVMGYGNVDAGIMAIGEGPGKHEDESGVPFVGDSGKLFDKMLASIGVSREEIFITNVVKCKVPNGRNPSSSECKACLDYVRKEFVVISPQIVLCLGAIATEYIYGKNAKLTRDRGKIIEKQGVYFLPTYHPSALLRQNTLKKDSWHDMQKLQKLAIDMGILKF